MIQQAGLSASQRKAVEHPLELPGVIAAGAGTGKTYTIVERVAALHESGQCPSDHVLLLTFGRKAAAELRSRIVRRLGEDAPACFTFHAFAWHVLQSHAYDVGISPETKVMEDADARVEFRKAFEDYLADPHAAPSGFPLRDYNRGEIRTALFALDQRIKQEGLTLEQFCARAITAADSFARVPYRQLRKPHLKPYKGQTHRIEAHISDEELTQEIVWEKQRVEACVDILRRFSHRLAARQALTYADILKLSERAIRNNRRLREELQRQYLCCIVDEYQDTDLAQHRLLEAIFGSGLARVMVVGDRLQSIFGFRGAHPQNVELFERAPESVVYTLVENRRSRQEILDFAHHLIVAGHRDAVRLESERGSADSQIIHVSSLWTNVGGSHPSTEEARDLEAQTVAARIASLLREHIRIEMNHASEPIAPKHIAILSRTKRNVQPVTEALVRGGVPFKLAGGVGFYDAPEIRDMLAWLRLLANPLDSSAVVRALQSPLIDASDAVMTRLAAGLGRDDTAFARRVLVEPLPNADELETMAKEKSETLRRLLNDLAPQSALPLLESLRAIIEATGIERHFQASSDPRAAAALANIEKLEALARSFADSTPGAQPADFVHFINELENVDFDEREADVSDRDAVTIATIHAAKGLEWPYVFVLGVWPQLPAGPRLRVDDTTGALLYSDNPDGSRSFHFAAVKGGADNEGTIIRDDERDENLEERRLLYVAATRARDHLFISGIRRPPSGQNPQGKAHRFIEEAHAWIDERGWGSNEKVGPAAPGSADIAPPRIDKSPARTNADSSHMRPANGVATTKPESSLAMPLSYSFIARFEQCPRQATYKRMFRLPETARMGGRKRRIQTVDEDATAVDMRPQDSLLGAGDYGKLLHTALEQWALEKRRKEHQRRADAYLDLAAELLGISAPEQQLAQARAVLDTVMEQLRAWQPVQIEAPFTLDFGEEGKPLLVTGYLDLLATDALGNPGLVDYKTGDPTCDHNLQLAVYQRAAREVYGIADARCFVGQIEGENFSLSQIEPVSKAELERRVSAVCRGLLERDITAKPGPWCWTCGYRAAPCRDYIKKRSS